MVNFFSRNGLPFLFLIFLQLGFVVVLCNISQRVCRITGRTALMWQAKSLKKKSCMQAPKYGSTWLFSARVLHIHSSGLENISPRWSAFGGSLPSDVNEDPCHKVICMTYLLLTAEELSRTHVTTSNSGTFLELCEEACTLPDHIISASRQCYHSFPSICLSRIFTKINEIHMYIMQRVFLSRAIFGFAWYVSSV